MDLSDIENSYEVEELRTLNSKTFKKVNNAYEVVLYGEDVHFEENGKLIEIDNSLIDNAEYFNNNKNKFKLNIPKKLNEYSKIIYNNNILEWKINSNYLETENAIKESKNKLVYNNAFGKKTKLEYLVGNNGIKENIELKEYIKDFKFSYSIKTDLRLENNNNKILLFNEYNEHVFTIKEYFMYDKSGKLSYDISYNIEKVGDFEYLISVTPNDAYLKSATYPVIIDPEIIINNMESVKGSLDTKFFDPMSADFPNESYPEYPTLTKKAVNGVDKSSKLLMRLSFPSDATYSGMSKLKTSNFLYSYVVMPTDGNVKSNPRTYCSSGECTVEASKVDTDLKWYQINGNSSYTTSKLSSQKFTSGSVFNHRFDIYDYMYENVDKFGTYFELLLEFKLNGGEGSFVKYTQSNSYYDSIPEYRLGYLDEAGLYDHYTYEQIPTSSSSTAYIAHNSGNLVYIYNHYSDGNLLNLSSMLDL